MESSHLTFNIPVARFHLATESVMSYAKKNITPEVSRYLAFIVHNPQSGGHVEPVVLGRAPNRVPAHALGDFEMNHCKRTAVINSLPWQLKTSYTSCPCCSPLRRRSSLTSRTPSSPANSGYKRSTASSCGIAALMFSSVQEQCILTNSSWIPLK